MTSLRFFFAAVVLAAATLGGCASSIAVDNDLGYPVRVAGTAYASAAVVSEPMSLDAPTEWESVDLGVVVVKGGESGALPKPVPGGVFRTGTVSLEFTPVTTAGTPAPTWRSCRAWISSPPQQVVLIVRPFEPGSERLVVEAREASGAVVENVSVRWDPPPANMPSK